MGLSASQFRYLSLTARQSDLEYQSQIICQQRIELANKSTDAAKAYADGMNNKIIKVGLNGRNTDGTATKTWKEMTYANLLEQGFNIIGSNGAPLDPSPYLDITEGATITGTKFQSLPDSAKEKFTANDDGTYTANFNVRVADPTFNGMDVQSVLVSGQGQIVTSAFYAFLRDHGYETGSYYDDKGEPTTYQKLLDQYGSDSATAGLSTVIDWRADASNMFKQEYYTEDDPAVLAKYEATTSEIQAQDKLMEQELKKIETEHKAIQTEMESVKKVIDKNIENTYKTFG